MELEKSNKESLDKYEASLNQVLEGNEEANVEDLSALDEGIKRGKQFKGEITNLAESLTTELSDLGQFFGNMSEYQGFFEKTYSTLGLTKWADNARLTRVSSADVTESLDTILDYGHHMVGKLYTAILENTECHARLTATIDTTNRKLTENQRPYEEWRSKKESLERKIKAVETELDNAEESEFGVLETKKSGFEKDLHEAQINENHFFTIVQKAQKALPVQRIHQNAYKDLMDSLTTFRTGLEEDIAHVTDIYQSTPIAIQTALKTKAASVYDKGLKYATDMATDAVLKAKAGVSDEVASRAERPLIEEEKLRAYKKFEQDTRADFDNRMSAIKDKYASQDSEPAGVSGSLD